MPLRTTELNIEIYGHGAVRGLRVSPFSIGVDTGCCYGGKLTALVMPGREVVQVDAEAVHYSPESSRKKKDKLLLDEAH